MRTAEEIHDEVAAEIRRIRSEKGDPTQHSFQMTAEEEQGLQPYANDFFYNAEKRTIRGMKIETI